MKSNTPGVLVINADTLLIRPQVWLSGDKTQILMTSFEYHKPYYQFLNRYGLTERKFGVSHITHHMLMQPNFLREIFNSFIGGDLENFIDEIIFHSSSGEKSPICVEFELYALGMRIMHPSKIQIRKFSNISVDPGVFKGLKDPDYISYNSVSLHAYLN